MKKTVLNLTLLLAIMTGVSGAQAFRKQRIKAIGIPLVDHYPAIVTFEKYRSEMKYVDYQLLLLPSPDLVRAYFQSENDTDMAFNPCPIVMDMRLENLIFAGSALYIEMVMPLRLTTS